MKNIENEIAGFAADLREWAAKRVPAADADDVVQEAMVRALASKDRIGTGNVRGFVFRIAARVLSDFLRARREAVLDFDPAAPEAVESEAPDREALDLVLRRLVRGSDDPARLLKWARLLLFEGWTRRQIAEDSGVTPNTVKIALHRLSRRVLQVRKRGSR